MKNRLLTIATILVLTCVGQAKDRPASTQNTGQAKSMPDLGTAIVYRQWWFGGAGRPNWKFSVDNGPDLVVRNGTYLRVDVPPDDYVLDHNHMFLWGSDPQTVHLRTGDTFKVLMVDQQLLRVRLAFCDAPEKRQAFGNRAKQAMSELVFGKEVELRPNSIDRYGRTVRSTRRGRK